MRRRARHLLRPLRGESGHTLIELMTVFVILAVILGALADAFRAGVQAELRANREYQAQQNARLALDRMRREVHCANAISGAPNGTAVATITVTLPPACQGTDTTVTYATELVASGRYRLMRTADAGTPVQVADYLTLNTIFTYTVPASGTLGRLSVDIPVNLNYPDTSTEWNLEDDIVLRNTTRL